MHEALDKIAFLPFGLIDKWRWKRFPAKSLRTIQRSLVAPANNTRVSPPSYAPN
jgi:hypothetical protein